MALKQGRFAATAVLLAGVFGLAGAVQAAEVLHREGEHLKPNGKGWGEIDPTGETAREAAKFSSASTNGILYHGGPLLLNSPVNIYYIWYGAWQFPADTTKSILDSFGGVGGTPYFNINTTYYDSTNTHVSGQIALSLTEPLDPNSQGSALSDASVQAIVANALNNGLPTDPNAVYFVLASQEINETSGLCTQYCAWHTHGTINGRDIKYAFIGNPARCPTACSGQQGATPNGNLGADGMANLIAHELSESVTDPDLNAWFDRRGYENADKCAWKFGTTQTLSSGAKYNVSFNLKNWLLQQNWINAGGGYCTLSK